MSLFWSGFEKRAASLFREGVEAAGKVAKNAKKAKEPPTLNYGKILKPTRKPEAPAIDYSKLDAPKVEEAAEKVIDLSAKSRRQKAKEQMERWVKMNQKRRAQQT